MFKKSSLTIILLSTILLLVTFNISWAQEKIDNYNINIVVNENATVDIEENIDYNFGEEKHHGIYRTIPIKYNTAGNNNRSIKIKKIKVLLDGDDVDFSTKRDSRNLKIKIGDPHKLISGQHRYEIDYQVSGALNYFDQHTELYWNVVGDQWDVPIEKVATTVKAPEIIKQTCFFGSYGSAKQCQINKVSTKEVSFIFPTLKPGEGATIVAGIKQGEIIKPALWQQWLWFLLDNWLLFLPGVFLLWGGLRWWSHGRDPEGRGTIIPYYDVPDDLSVAEVSAILHNGLRSKDISAMIIQLAVKGFIKIKQEKTGKVFKHTNYIFHKSEVHKNKGTQLTSEEEYLLKALFEFGSNDKVATDNLKEKFYTKVSALKKKVLKDIKKKGYLPAKSQYNGGTLIIVGALQMIVLAFLSAFMGSTALVSGIISSVILVFFAILMGHRTKKGVEAKEKLLGLKLYLETAEKDRLKFHNAPSKNPQRFEKLLPYAMVFGVEKEWAEQFKDIYKEQPEWYEGANGQAFNSVVLANSLNSFGKTASSSVVSAPSSAGSGGSGFSGGGSGGGFGGGGGGSW